MQKKNTNIEKLRVQALSILCTPYPLLDFHGFSSIQVKMEPHCSMEQDISRDTFTDYDGFSSNQYNLDPCCNTNEQVNNDTSSTSEGTKQHIQNNDEENIEEREFSFTCADVQEMGIFANDIFENGKIKTFLPHLNQSFLFISTQNNVALDILPPIKKTFINNSIGTQSKSDGSCRETENELLENITLVEAKDSSECYEKSSYTGSSNLWRFRKNMNLICNSDHKDSLVSLNSSAPKNYVKTKVENIAVKKRKDGHLKNAPSAYEKLYLTNKTRTGSNKRRSFLPYKDQLFGFFTNKNGLSRNLHQF